MFQCRTRLCGWCSNGKVGTYISQKKFQCRTRLCEWCSGKEVRFFVEAQLFQCRTRLCEWCNHEEGFGYVCLLLVSMPHAAIPFRPHHRFAVPLPRSRRGGLVTRRFLAESRNIRFPRRCGGSGERSEPIGALMPHAALWVVQQ